MSNAGKTEPTGRRTGAETTRTRSAGAGRGGTDDRALPALSVVAAQWADRPPEEALHTAALAGELGYPELWIGEASTYDAFALATAVGLATERIRITIGPLSLAVRNPDMIAMGAASVAALTRHPVTIAVTEPSASDRDTSARDADVGSGGTAGTDATDAGPEGPVAVLHAQLTGQREEDAAGSKPRLPAAGGGVTVAALTAPAVRAAAETAERVVLDLVDVATTSRVRGELEGAAARLGRDAPRLVVRLPAAVDPSAEALAQFVRALVPYLDRPGYREMFAAAGFAEVAELAHGGAEYREIVRALPLEIIGTVGLIGTRAEVTERLTEYAVAGADEVAVSPATAADRGGASTLAALHDLRP